MTHQERPLSRLAQRKTDEGTTKAHHPSMIRALHIAWSVSSPRELAALAIAKASWPGQLRISETIPNHLTNSNSHALSLEHIRSHPNSSTIHLPWTKVTRFNGATVSLLHQEPSLDATSAIFKHLSASPLSSRASTVSTTPSTSLTRKPL